MLISDKGGGNDNILDKVEVSTALEIVAQDGDLPPKLLKLRDAWKVWNHEIMKAVEIFIDQEWEKIICKITDNPDYIPTRKDKQFIAHFIKTPEHPLHARSMGLKEKIISFPQTDIADEYILLLYARELGRDGVNNLSASIQELVKLLYAE